MNENIITVTGNLCAEPEVVIGELDGPVGQALDTLLGDQVKGHTRVFAILNSDVQVRPATLMVSKVTVKDARYTGILMGTVQAGIAHGVLDRPVVAISAATGEGVDACGVALHDNVVDDDVLVNALSAGAKRCRGIGNDQADIIHGDRHFALAPGADVLVASVEDLRVVVGLLR